MKLIIKFLRVQPLVDEPTGCCNQGQAIALIGARRLCNGTKEIYVEIYLLFRRNRTDNVSC